MDIQMPILDGYATTQKIRAIDHLSTIPIIGVSAGISKENQHIYIQRGMSDTLDKPFTLEDLYRTLNIWLRKNHSQP
jgi:CheY-like chemotaxis protein